MAKPVDRLLLKVEGEAVAFGGCLQIDYVPVADGLPLEQLGSQFFVGGDLTVRPDRATNAILERVRLITKSLEEFVNREYEEIEI